MKEFFITFRSITYAQRGQTVLRGAGISTSLGRTPRWMEEKGCGYSLRVSPAQATQAAALLRSQGVPFSKLYVRQDGGKLEALAP